MKRQKKERNWGKIFTIAVLLSFMAPIGYLVVRIISGDTADGVGRGREDYVLCFCSACSASRRSSSRSA